MTPNKLDAPKRITHYTLDGLDRQDAETLREIATHTENPVAWKKAKIETESEEGEDIVHEDSTEGNGLLDDVPKKAGVVVRTIDGNQYYYHQRREGDQMKFRYKGPISPSE